MLVLQSKLATGTDRLNLRLVGVRCPMTTLGTDRHPVNGKTPRFGRCCRTSHLSKQRGGGRDSTTSKEWRELESQPDVNCRSNSESTRNENRQPV